MEWNEIITLSGVFFGGAVAAYVGYFRKGQNAASDKHVELAGALVDSSSVKRLSAAIEAFNTEAVTRRTDAEKDRQIGHRMIEVLNRVIDEIAELRHEIGDLAKEIARSK